MTTLLDMPEIRQRVLPVSVEDYHRRSEGRKKELLREIILRKVAKSPRHYNLVETLRTVLSAQLPPGFVIRQEGPLRSSAPRFTAFTSTSPRSSRE